MIKKSRLDIYLLNKGLCETRQKAQGLILAGKVRDINGKVLDKPGQQVLIGSEFFVDSEPMFVSRGGEKLLEALKKLEINVKFSGTDNYEDIKNSDVINTCCPGLSHTFPLISLTLPARIKPWAFWRVSHKPLFKRYRSNLLFLIIY